MAMTLAGYSLPTPTGHEQETGYRGTTYGMADGTMQIDVVNATPKDRWTLSWPALTAAQYNNLINAYNDCVTASRTLVDFEGNSHTVTVSEGLPPIKWKRVMNAGTPRYEVTITLREV